MMQQQLQEMTQKRLTSHQQSVVLSNESLEKISEILL